MTISEFVTREVQVCVTRLVRMMCRESDYFRGAMDRMGDGCFLRGKYSQSEAARIQISQYWVVSKWLAGVLLDRGEVVESDFFGLQVWARTENCHILKDPILQQFAETRNREQ